MLKKAEIFNRAVFVVCYYGGTHLGPSRFQAFIEAAQSAITHDPYNGVSKENQTPWPKAFAPHPDRTTQDSGTLKQAISPCRRVQTNRNRDKNQPPRADLKGNYQVQISAHSSTNKLRTMEADTQGKDTTNNTKKIRIVTITATGPRRDSLLPRLVHYPRTSVICPELGPIQKLLNKLESIANNPTKYRK